jgi:Fe-S cluster biosynthesis and repair protein YggX
MGVTAAPASPKAAATSDLLQTDQPAWLNGLQSRYRNFFTGVGFMARMVDCIKLNKEAEGLDFPPYPGELGKKIFERVSKEAWQQWIKHQTMLVNENRLNLADARARKYLAQQMEKHFFGDGADVATGYVPPQA